MTEENYKYRTSPFFLRNQFHGVGKLEIPTIPKSYFREEDFTNLKLIGFDKTSLENNNHLDRMVHFFLYDYKFERVWKNPENDLEKLKRYRAVLTPDFSVYREIGSGHAALQYLPQSLVWGLFCFKRHSCYPVCKLGR